MKKIPFFLILGVLSIFTTCKNPNTTDGSNGSIDSFGTIDNVEQASPVYQGDVETEYGEVTYFNVSGDSLLLVNEQMSTENLPNSRIKISDYLGKMRFDSKASLLYCSYAAGQDFDCYASDYSQKLYFENNRFLFKATGSKEILVSCYLNFLQTHNIPETNGRDDLGEREKVANFFIKYYSLDPNLENVFTLFNTYFPPRRDKAKLWGDLVNLLVPKDERTNDISRQISGFNSRLSTMVQYRSTIQLGGSASQEPDLDDLSCDELTDLVQNDGYHRDNLSSGELDSEMLESVDLYEYDGSYYVIADFQRGGTYIYCDVSMSAWSNFTDNDYDSFGRSFEAYIADDFICNCN
ncbi:MAG: hypothetical protein IPN29_15930 [Saprospiraceae bacterium]|nr:hypothetical protein [Saprospiraceae bacterium]